MGISSLHTYGGNGGEKKNNHLLFWTVSVFNIILLIWKDINVLSRWTRWSETLATWERLMWFFSISHVEIRMLIPDISFCPNHSVLLSALLIPVLLGISVGWDRFDCKSAGRSAWTSCKGARTGTCAQVLAKLLPGTRVCIYEGSPMFSEELCDSLGPGLSECKEILWVN